MASSDSLIVSWNAPSGRMRTRGSVTLGRQWRAERVSGLLSSRSPAEVSGDGSEHPGGCTQARLFLLHLALLSRMEHAESHQTSNSFQ